MNGHLVAALAPLRAEPSRTLLAFDFDGTLSPVVDDPAAAVALPGVTDLLDELARTYARVAVVSGRPISFLARHLSPAITLSGLYGLEERIDGRRRDHPDAERWRPVVAGVAAEARARCGPEGPLMGASVEAKGLSITLHVRTHPHLEAAVQALAVELAGPADLQVRGAKRSVEIHPPIAADKGTALRSLAAGLDAALYVGDDLGDVPAFATLRSLCADGLLDRGLSVAVGGEELPTPLAREADLVLAGQAEVLDLLRGLRPHVRP